MSTFEEIVSAIRSLPLPERLRIAEHVIHEVASLVPAAPEQTTDDRGTAELQEEGRLLIVKAHCTYPAEMFDHRAIREERLHKLA